MESSGGPRPLSTLGGKRLTDKVSWTRPIAKGRKERRGKKRVTGKVSVGRGVSQKEGRKEGKEEGRKRLTGKLD